MFAFALQFLQAMPSLWVLKKHANMNIYPTLELFLKKLGKYKIKFWSSQYFWKEIPTALQKIYRRLKNKEPRPSSIEMKVEKCPLFS